LGSIWHVGDNSGVSSLQRASWLTVVGICALAAILLAISGYSGYCIVVAAVGLSAAINLL
jgi:hypothetical protein